MGRLWHYLGRYWRQYLIGGVCLLVTATLVMWIPWWTREVVRIIEQGGTMRDVTFYALLIIAAALLQGVVRTYSRALIFNAGRNVEYDLRNDLFAHLEKLPLSFYQSHRTGDLMSRVINDISAVRVMLGPGVLNFVNAPLYYVYAVALMLSMDVRMTLAALAPFPLLMYVARKFRGRIMNSSTASAAADVGLEQPRAGESKRHARGQSLLPGRFSNPAVHRFQQRLRSQKHGDGQAARHRQPGDAGHQRPDRADRHLVRRRARHCAAICWSPTSSPSSLT